MYTTEEFRRQVYLWYDTNGITVGDCTEGNWEHAHIVPRCCGGTETVLLLHGHHIMHDLYQSREYNRRCFHGSAKAWLYGEGFLCENWFELVELFTHYFSQGSARMNTERWTTMDAEAKAARLRHLHQIGLSSRSPEEHRAISSAGGTASWTNIPPEVRAARKEAMAAGSSAYQAALGLEERRARSQKALAARWAKAKAERALRSLGSETYGAMWAGDTL